jgi:hypothetical protein
MSDKSTTQRDWVSEYNSAKGSDKVAVRREAEAARDQAIMDGDIVAAQELMQIINGLAPTPKGPARTIGMNLADREVTLRAALERVNQAHKDLDDKDKCPEDYTPVVNDEQAQRYATVGATTKGKGRKGGWDKWFVDAIEAGHLSGTVTVSDVTKVAAPAGPFPYGTQSVSGAIGAAFNRYADGDDAEMPFTYLKNDEGVASLVIG